MIIVEPFGGSRHPYRPSPACRLSASPVQKVDRRSSAFAPVPTFARSALPRIKTAVARAFLPTDLPPHAENRQALWGRGTAVASAVDEGIFT